MNKALWAFQILLGIAFVMAGAMKLVTPTETLATEMAWVNHAPAVAVKLIGLLELLGGLGLILPSALRIKPALTPLAASGLVLVMLGAVGTHVALGEANLIGAPLVLGALCAFIAWGRGKKHPIAGK